MADAQQKVSQAINDVEKARTDLNKAQDLVRNLQENTVDNSQAIEAAKSKRTSALEIILKSIRVREDGQSGN